MAISFLGSTAWSKAAGTLTLSTGLSDAAGGHPTLQQYDVLIVTMAVGHSTSASITAPSGYSLLHTAVIGSDTGTTTLNTFWKRMGATPDTTLVPPSTPTGSADGMTVFAFRGVNRTTLLDGTVQTANGANSGNADSPSITPTTSGSWIIASGGAANNAALPASLTRPANLSSTTAQFRTSASSSTYGAGVATGLKTDWTSGAFDPGAFSTTNTATTESWAAVTYAIKQEPPRRYERTVSITY